MVSSITPPPPPPRHGGYSSKRLVMTSSLRDSKTDRHVIARENYHTRGAASSRGKRFQSVFACFPRFTVAKENKKLLVM